MNGPVLKQQETKPGKQHAMQGPSTGYYAGGKDQLSEGSETMPLKRSPDFFWLLEMRPPACGSRIPSGGNFPRAIPRLLHNFARHSHNLCAKTSTIEAVFSRKLLILFHRTLYWGDEPEQPACVCQMILYYKN